MAQFSTEVQRSLSSWVQIERVDAVNGKTLPIQDPTLQSRVRPWNYQNLPEKSLRGVIGCCLSHLECYRRLLMTHHPHAMIFEDDCMWLPGRQSYGMEVLENVVFPSNFGIIYCNQWDLGVTVGEKNEWNTLRPVLRGYKTAEAYIISREFAQIVYSEMINQIGAIDAHFAEIATQYPHYPCYTLCYDLFIQRDRTDTDIQSNIVINY